MSTDDPFAECYNNASYSPTTVAVTAATTTLVATTAVFDSVTAIALTNQQQHYNNGLLIIADFANARLKDYPNPLFTGAAITNANQIQEEVLTPMEEHWEWMSLGQETFHWHILRIVLDENLSENAFSGAWMEFRNAVAAKIWQAYEEEPRNGTMILEDFDKNRDGVIDSSFVVVANHGQYYDYLVSGASRNGQVNMFVDVQDSLSLRGRHIGNFNHEVARNFSLPDIYGAYDTLKYLTVMSDSWPNPPNGFSAFERYKLGWLVPTLVTASTQGIVLRPAEQYMEAIIVTTQLGTEYFLIEYRKRNSSGYGSSAPVAYNGLAIYHVWEDSPEGNRELPALIRLESPPCTYRWNSIPEMDDFSTPSAPDSKFLGVPYYDDTGEHAHVEIDNFQWAGGGESGIQMDIKINNDMILTNYSSDLFANGNFENGSVETGPLNWATHAWILSYSSFSWESTGGVNGTACGKIQNIVANDASFVQTIGGLKAGERYRLTADLKNVNRYGYIQYRGNDQSIWHLGKVGFFYQCGIQ